MLNKLGRSLFLLTVTAASLGAAGLFITGCEEYCEDLQTSYRQSLSEERTELEEPEGLSGDSPAQFGLSLKTGLIGDILNIVLQPALQTAMNAAPGVDIPGLGRASITSRGELLKLDVDSDSACDNCFSVGGNLGGSIIAEIPGFGQKTANLGGSLNLVAPLLLNRGDDADAALRLDLPQFVNIGRSSISTRLSGVSQEIAGFLEGPLSDIFFEAIADRVDPVTIVEFDAPSFGIPGFKILPTELVTKGESGTVFAGFATNIKAMNAPGMASVSPIVDLGEEENFAFAFQPAIIQHSLSLLLDGGQVSRTYDLNGRAEPNGNSHVTLDRFRVGPEALQPRSPAGAEPDAYSEDTLSEEHALSSRDFPLDESDADVPFALGFDVFNFSNNSAMCLGFGAEAVGGVSVRQDALKVDLLDVRFTDDRLQENLVSLSTWAGADFIQESHNLVNKSLSSSTISVPGTSLKLDNLGLGLRENAVVLRANSTPEE